MVVVGRQRLRPPPSLRAKRSNPEYLTEETVWIASSLSRLAMTAVELSSGGRSNCKILSARPDGGPALRAYVFPNNNSTEWGDGNTSTQARRLHAPGQHSHRRLALSR